MNVDTTALPTLMEEARDLHADAMKRATASLPALAEVGRDRARQEPDTAELDGADRTRRQLLAGMGLAAGGLLAGVLAEPVRADTALDVQILQTASSLEALAVATYAVVLGEGPAGADAPAARALASLPAAGAGAGAAVAAFARETRRQHAEHLKAFQAQTTALGGRPQDAPNPKFVPLVAGADLSTPAKVIDLAATLEKVATDSYLLNLAMLQDRRTRALLAGVMAVEAQHLAILRTVDALLRGGTPEFVALPFPTSSLMSLPGTTGSAAFPDALHQVAGAELIAEPGSGAVT